MNKNELLEYVVTKIKDPDEPLFLLRGKDALAYQTVLHWIVIANSSRVNFSKVDKASEVLDSMLKYQDKRLPD